MQTQQAVRTTLSIDGETYRALADLARQNERSASAEARVAIRTHVLAADAADKPAVVGSAGVGAAAGGSDSFAVRGRLSARSAGRAHEQGPGRGDPD